MPGQFPFEDAAQHLVEAAIRNEATISAAAVELREIEQRLGRQVRTLPEWVAAEVDRKLAATVNGAASQISDKFSATSKAAERAQLGYENAARFAIGHITRVALMCFACGCLGMIIGVYISARVILPAPDILQRASEAEEAVKKLAPRGGNSVLTDCPMGDGSSRLCIRTDERDPRIWHQVPGDTIRLIYGY
jgi:hypothetical protein